MKRSTLILLTLLPALLRAVDSSQVLMEEPGRTNRSALAYLESLSTVPHFATTGFVRTAAATGAYSIVSATLYPYLAGRTDRFSTNWSYYLRGGGGFAVDNFHVRDTLTVQDLDWTAGGVTSRVVVSPDVSGFADVLAGAADLRGPPSPVDGVDTAVAVFRDAHLSRAAGLEYVDAPAVFFHTEPVLSASWLSDNVVMPPGVHEVAAAESTNANPAGVQVLAVAAVVPSYTNFFRLWHTYRADTNRIEFRRLHLEPQIGPLYRLGMQIAVTPGRRLTPGTFQYSLHCYDEAVLTHRVTTGSDGIPVETGPSFAVVDSLSVPAPGTNSPWASHAANDLLCFTITGPATVAGEPFFYRVRLDRVTGMEMAEP